MTWAKRTLTPIFLFVFTIQATLFPAIAYGQQGPTTPQKPLTKAAPKAAPAKKGAVTPPAKKEDPKKKEDEAKKDEPPILKELRAAAEKMKSENGPPAVGVDASATSSYLVDGIKAYSQSTKNKLKLLLVALPAVTYSLLEIIHQNKMRTERHTRRLSTLEGARRRIAPALEEYNRSAAEFADYISAARDQSNGRLNKMLKRLSATSREALADRDVEIVREDRAQRRAEAEAARAERSGGASDPAAIPTEPAPGSAQPSTTTPTQRSTAELAEARSREYAEAREATARESVARGNTPSPAEAPTENPTEATAKAPPTLGEIVFNLRRIYGELRTRYASLRRVVNVELEHISESQGIELEKMPEMHELNLTDAEGRSTRRGTIELIDSSFAENEKVRRAVKDLEDMEKAPRTELEPAIGKMAKLKRLVVRGRVFFVLAGLYLTSEGLDWAFAEQIKGIDRMVDRQQAEMLVRMLRPTQMNEYFAFPMRNAICRAWEENFDLNYADCPLSTAGDFAASEPTAQGDLQRTNYAAVHYLQMMRIYMDVAIGTLESERSKRNEEIQKAALSNPQAKGDEGGDPAALLGEDGIPSLIVFKRIFHLIIYGNAELGMPGQVKTQEKLGVVLQRISEKALDEAKIILKIPANTELSDLNESDAKAVQAKQIELRDNKISEVITSVANLARQKYSELPASVRMDPRLQIAPGGLPVDLQEEMGELFKFGSPRKAPGKPGSVAPSEPAKGAPPGPLAPGAVPPPAEGTGPAGIINGEDPFGDGNTDRQP